MELLLKGHSQPPSTQIQGEKEKSVRIFTAITFCILFYQYLINACSETNTINVKAVH